jgi:hypothetical protein
MLKWLVILNLSLGKPPFLAVTIVDLRFICTQNHHSLHVSTLLNLITSGVFVVTTGRAGIPAKIRPDFTATTSLKLVIL